MRAANISTGYPASVDSLASPMHLPKRYRPQWHVDSLVYQGGIPVLKLSSLVGGGQIPMRNPPRGYEPLVFKTYATPVSSGVGGGHIPTRPNFLTRLIGALTGQPGQ